MKTFTINRKSWHYRFVNYFGGSGDHNLDNFCNYFGAFIGSVALTSFLSALALVVTVAVGDTLAWFVAGLMHTFVQPSDPWGWGGIIIVGGVIITTGGMLFSKFKRKRELKKWELLKAGIYNEPEPGFFGLAYEKFKTKTCMKIEFLGE